MTRYIYNIATREQWEEATACGEFKGAPVDLEDGYIHFSTAKQAQETAEKHFFGQTDLLLIKVGVLALGDALKWEPSRGGDLFPHLYAKLPTNAAVDVIEIEDRADGGHAFPELK